MTPIRLDLVLREAVATPYRDLVTRSTGVAVRNHLLATLRDRPLADAHHAARIVAASRDLVTSLGLRSLSPDDLAYRGLHQGSPAERDGAYHQGTVWPWLIGPYVDAVVRAGGGTEGLLDGLISNQVHHVARFTRGDPREAMAGFEVFLHGPSSPNDRANQRRSFVSSRRRAPATARLGRFAGGELPAASVRSSVPGPHSGADQA